eukprot:scaffold11331_cov101-Isochrysis_galbana.AAC.3
MRLRLAPAPAVAGLRPARAQVEGWRGLVVRVEDSVDALVHEGAVRAGDKVQEDGGGHVVVADQLLHVESEARPAVPRVERLAEREVLGREHAVGEVGDGHVEQRHHHHHHLECIEDGHVAREAVQPSQHRHRQRQQQHHELGAGAEKGADDGERDEGDGEAAVEGPAPRGQQAQLQEGVLRVEPLCPGGGGRARPEDVQERAGDGAGDERLGPGAEEAAQGRPRAPRRPRPTGRAPGWGSGRATRGEHPADRQPCRAPPRGLRASRWPCQTRPAGRGAAAARARPRRGRGTTLSRGRGRGGRSRAGLRGRLRKRTGPPARATASPTPSRGHARRWRRPGSPHRSPKRCARPATARAASPGQRLRGHPSRPPVCGTGFGACAGAGEAGGGAKGHAPGRGQRGGGRGGGQRGGWRIPDGRAFGAVPRRHVLLIQRRGLARPRRVVDECADELAEAERPAADGLQPRRGGARGQAAGLREASVAWAEGPGLPLRCVWADLVGARCGGRTNGGGVGGEDRPAAAARRTRAARLCASGVDTARRSAARQPSRKGVRPHR